MPYMNYYKCQYCGGGEYNLMSEGPDVGQCPDCHKYNAPYKSVEQVWAVGVRARGYEIDNRTIICADDSELTEMIESILEWWDAHQLDERRVTVGDLSYTAQCYHDGMDFLAPRFVELAQKWSN